MCFSPQADLVGGVVIAAIGVDAIRHVDHRRELRVLAAIPVLLGAHQFIEGFIWLWLRGQVPRAIGVPALWAYLIIAFTVLPAVIPAAIMALEPTRRRTLMMAPFAALGVLVAAVLLGAMLRGPVGVDMAAYHLAYSVRLPHGLLITALYVVAVCGPLLLSGYRHVVVFGAVNLAAVIILARLTVSGFASLWCAWAAVSSAAVALECRLGSRGPGQSHTGIRRSDRLDHTGART